MGHLRAFGGGHGILIRSYSKARRNQETTALNQINFFPVRASFPLRQSPAGLGGQAGMRARGYGPSRFILPS